MRIIIEITVETKGRGLMCHLETICRLKTASRKFKDALHKGHILTELDEIISVKMIENEEG